MTIDQVIPPIPHNKLDSPRDTSQSRIAEPITFRRSSIQMFRSRSNKNPLCNFGGNRQNLNAKQRRLREADRGYKLINRDLSGADALIVSLLCKQGPYRELFQNDIKPHTYIALHLFPDVWRVKFNTRDVDIALRTSIPNLSKLEFWPALSKLIKSSDTWPPFERYYYFGKKSGHSFNYGQQEQTFVDTIFLETGGAISIPIGEGARWKYKYHDLFPEIQAHFQFGTLNYAKRFGFLRNLFGWPYNLTKDIKHFSQKDINELYAWIPQSTVACITLMALVEFQDWIEDNDKNWHILNEVHDSILIEAPENDIEEAAIILGQFMKKELTSPVDGYKFKMKSECKIGLNYGDYSEENPDGMREVKI